MPEEVAVAETAEERRARLAERAFEREGEALTEQVKADRDRRAPTRAGTKTSRREADEQAGKRVSRRPAAKPEELYHAPDVLRDKARVRRGQTEAARRSADAQAEVKAEAAEVAQPQAQPVKASRYVEDVDLVRSLSERLTAARKLLGQARIAELAGVKPFAIWRAERQLKVEAAEVEPIIEALTMIERGDVPNLVRRSTAGGKIGKAELEHRIEVATKALRAAVEDGSVKSRTAWLQVVNEALLTLDPPAAS